MHKAGLPLHNANNKLRDVDDKYAQNGHIFSYNREIFGSFDLCGSCEAHALLFGVKHGLASSIESSTSLFELDEKHTKNNIDFKKCPERSILFI